MQACPALLFRIIMFLACSLAVSAGATVAPLQFQGQDVVDSSGNPVRFWGVNVLTFYPTHATAERFAANLASRGINLVRWHHLNRPSLDWNWQSQIPAMLDYSAGNSRTPDSEAWDRFDYLNAELEKHGIYIMVATHWTRDYLPGDVTIMHTTAEDDSRWSAAVQDLVDLDSADWSAAFDLKKLLPVIDERAARLEEEFLSRLLLHENPYKANRRYIDDPQLLTLEVLNEYTSEYAVIAGNTYIRDGYPDLAYFEEELEQKWQAWCTGHGLSCSGLRDHINGNDMREEVSGFLQDLDRTYYNRIKGLITSLGGDLHTVFTTNWRTETGARLNGLEATHTEDHVYADPFVVRERNDFIHTLSARTVLADKPFFLGEYNISAGSPEEADARRNQRTMQLLAASAYGSLHNWSGIVWFAWNHGDRRVDQATGWGTDERQEPPTDQILGDTIQDAMLNDHLRTAGLLFRNRLVDVSSAPITVYVDTITHNTSPDWSTFVAPETVLQPGWQNIHSIRKLYGPPPQGYDISQYLTGQPANPLVSDTGQLVKDINRMQLTVAAPGAEAFSGNLDSGQPAGLSVLGINEQAGFATVILVATDGLPLADSANLLISRTYIADGERPGPGIVLHNLRQEPGKQWQIRYTRPRATYAGSLPVTLSMAENGDLLLPDTSWREAELVLTDSGTPGNRLTNNQPVTGLQAPFEGETREFTLTIPEGGAKYLQVILTGGQGDADLRVDGPALYCVSDGGSNAENCEFRDIPAGDLTVEVYTWAGYSDVTLLAAYVTPADLLFNLPPGQWQQYSLPWGLSQDRATVADVLGDDLAGSYGTDWILYRFDAAAQLYVNPGPDGLLDSGIGYWLIRPGETASIIDLPEDAAPPAVVFSGQCTGLRGCAEIPLVTREGLVTWNMIGNPFPRDVPLDQVRLVTSPGSDCAAGCTLAEAGAAGIVHPVIWHWTGTTYTAVSGDMSLPRGRGFWFPTLPGGHGLQPRLLVPR